MEEKGIEWVCPNCTKKKEQESGMKQTKLQFKPLKPMKLELQSRPSTDSSLQASTSRTILSPTEKSTKPMSVHSTTPVAGVTQCVVCKKEARNSSIYCSDTCILAHAQETLTKESKPTVQPRSEAPTTKTDPRVIVFERKTGKVITGQDAPTTSTLKTWLKEHPTFEVVRPNNLNTLQIGGKTVTTIQSQGSTKLVCIRRIECHVLIIAGCHVMIFYVVWENS